MKEFKYLTIFNQLSRKFCILLCKIIRIYVLFQMVTTNFACTTHSSHTDEERPVELSKTQLVKDVSDAQARVIDSILIKQMPHLREYSGSILLSRGGEQYVLSGMTTSVNLTSYTLITAIFLRAAEENAYTAMPFAAPVQLRRPDHSTFQMKLMTFGRAARGRDAQVHFEFTDAKKSFVHKVDLTLSADRPGLAMALMGANDRFLQIYGTGSSAPLQTTMDDKGVLAFTSAAQSIAVSQKNATFLPASQATGGWIAKPKAATQVVAVTILPARLNRLGIPSLADVSGTTPLKITAQHESHVTSDASRSLSVMLDNNLVELVNLNPDQSIDLKLPKPGTYKVVDNLTGMNKEIAVDSDSSAVEMPARPIGTLQVKVPKSANSSTGTISIEASDVRFARSASLPSKLPNNLQRVNSTLLVSRWPVDLILPAANYRVRVRDLEQKVSCTTSIQLVADKQATIDCSTAMPEPLSKNLSIERSIQRVRAATFTEPTSGQRFVAYGLAGEARDAINAALSNKVADAWLGTLEKQLAAQKNLETEAACPPQGIERATYLKAMRIVKPSSYLLHGCKLASVQLTADELYRELNKIGVKATPLMAFPDASAAAAGVIQAEPPKREKDKAGRLTLSTGVRTTVESGFKATRVVVYSDSGVVAEQAVTNQGEPFSVDVPWKNQPWLRLELRGIKDLGQEATPDLMLGTTDYLYLDVAAPKR